ncbi:hypothetical protein F2Q68_00021345 [Brassica cretica]|uniref:Uncharacterized protein n=1 Tax=Brassica cretica TaxID=69181 RepID=A0A8S9FPK2_BRACR|nr:hypothetical protein F2Q68_00021345 [Brassica cretica]
MLEPGGLDPKIAGWNPEEPGGSSLDPEILLIGTRRLWGNPKGPYSAFIGKTTTGTCLDFAFCRSEAGHYRVPMISPVQLLLGDTIPCGLLLDLFGLATVFREDVCLQGSWLLKHEQGDTHLAIRFKGGA